MKKLLSIVISGIVLFTFNVNSLHGEAKENPIVYPTIEEIMHSYEVDEEEAQVILKRMQYEDEAFKKESLVRTRGISEEEKIKNQLIEDMLKEESEEITLGISPYYVNAGGGWMYVPTPIVRQETGWWCGPAAVQMALGARGVNKSQSALASEIGTTYEYGSSGQSMKNVLNRYVGNWYVWKDMTNWDTSLVEYGVRLNIKNDYTPIMGVYQATGGSRTLPGHTNEKLRHFITVTGYVGTNASTIVYNDPIHGYGGRFAGVPAYSRVSSETMAYLVWQGSMIY